ncbi:hypothetical protein D9757_007400 [Collybiopsis confluens]|uniref:DUF6533 domain-containing protein n=1 Tax=Collybiopsis confluens TaxID=2823264 RepID=A0A8H5M7T5_9AGAR|nr:hypothetical protein D9757_007400 [Collybiopsis confluens]
MNTSGSSLTDSQLRTLAECVANGRIGQGITYATSVLFVYDYILTVWDEVKYVWKPKKATISSISFFLARYTAMAGIIVSALPGSNNATATTSATTVLRLISIVASELIITVRTWAIWSKNRKIMVVLAVFALATIIPPLIILSIGIVTNRVEALVSEEFIDVCSLVVSNINQQFIAIYICTILYEFVMITLSLIRILSWRKTIPKNIRAPIMDNLWRDGVLYFSFILVLGFVNIGIVLQQGVPQIRSASSQLQAVIHSVLSTRMVLHLASSRDSRDITAPGTSVYLSSADVQFTSEIAGQTLYEDG